MSSQIATLERVKAAVEALHAEGAKATADAVLAHIGGGSKPTVLKHLRTLREVKDAPAEPLPLNLLEKAKPVLADIFAAGAAAQEARTREQTERYHRIMSDLEAQLLEFEETVTRQERREDELHQTLATTEEALAEAMKRIEEREAEAARLLEQRDAEIERLQEQLADCRRDQAQALSERFEIFEARIADLTRRLEQNDTAKDKGADKKG